MDFKIIGNDQWTKELQKFIYTEILPKSVSPKDNEYMKDLVSEEAMQIWVKAFTHKSYDANILKNYETLEKLGDPSVKAAFTQRIIQKYPAITPGELSNMTTYYLAKMKQAQISEELGLPNWMRILTPHTPSTKEDALEAVHGALCIVGDLIIGSGNGQSLSSNFTYSIYDFDNITIEGTQRDPKMKLKDTFEKLGWFSGKQLEFIDIEKWTPNPNDKNKWQLDILLPIEGKTQIREQKLGKYEGKSTDYLARQYGRSKQGAIKKAYSQAVDTLNDYYGITHENASLMKREYELTKIPEKAREKLASTGYVDIDYSFDKAGGSTHIQLIGITENGEADILLSLQSSENYSKNKLINIVNDLYENMSEEEMSQYKGKVYKL